MSNKFEVVDGVVDLGNEVDVNRVAELYQELKVEVSMQSSKIDIDASSVERVDGAMIQMLVAFSQAYTGNGGILNWGTPSAEFSKAARILGLDKALGLPA